jgi:PAS domain S-box-containing protein
LDRVLGSEANPRDATYDNAYALVQETLVHDLLYGSPVAFLVVDEGLGVLIANEAAEELTGYTRTELRELAPGVIAADPERSSKNAALIHIGGRLASTTTIRHRDGHPVPCAYFAWQVSVSRMPFIAVLLWPTPGDANE